MKSRLVIALTVIGCGSNDEVRVAPRVDMPATAIASHTPAFDVPAPRDKILGVGRNDTYACVVRESGGVDCWGQLGIGRPEPRARRIPGVTDAKAISPDGACVLRATGQVACHARDRLELVTIEGLSDVVTLGTGDAGCFVIRDGGVMCVRVDFVNPVRVPELTDAVAVTQGSDEVCAVRKSGQVVCGDNPGWRTPAPFVALAGIGAVRRFVLGRGSTANSGCAILETGVLRCFGLRYNEGSPIPFVADDDRYGQAATGFDPAMFAGATEVSVVEEPDFATHHSIVLEAIVGGKVARWDRNGSAVLADLADASQLAPGCALRAQGSVVCWGVNAGGALGQPTTIGRMRRPPATVVGVANVDAIALSASDAWARTRDGHVFHWGRHAGGSATEVPLPPGAGKVTAITVTDFGSACVLSESGAVWCWTPHAPAFARLHDKGIISIAGERKSLLALGAGGVVTRTRLDAEAPGDGSFEQPPPAPPDSIALTSGASRACALSRTGTIACGKQWKRVAGVEGATQVDTDHRGCALQSGTVKCFEYEYSSDVSELKPMVAITNAIDLARTDDRLCVVRSQGKVECWLGHEMFAIDVIAAGALDVELGPADLDDLRYGPGNGAAPGGPFGCAIMRDRSVKCWGANTAGELGDGSIKASTKPLGVPGL